jgi:hypothetical protein
MIFNRHSDFEGLHASLSASKYSWLNYDEDKMARVFTTQMAAKRGTELHDLASQMIRLGVKLEDKPKTLNMYVNDCIGFRMIPEQVLKYSINAFGTADAVSFRNRRLRIFDLKTGVTPTSMWQPRIYAALFCLEYKHRPFQIETELRIYQNDEIMVEEADPDEIFHIMDKIVTFDKLINRLREEMS